MNNKTYIIAEAGSNFDGDLDQAFKLIEIAAAAGADAVKFQMFNADILYPDQSSDVHKIVKKSELPRKWVDTLIKRCEALGIDFLCSPFDTDALKILIEEGVKDLKWGSSETTNLNLLREAAKTGKKIYLSTGTCTMSDISDAVEVLDKNNSGEVILLHCYSVYPTNYEDCNLKVMETLRQAFGLRVGLSDHSLGTAIPIAAVAMGAEVIEKHFTISREFDGPDHSYALEPDELKSMVLQIRQVEAALGVASKKLHQDEFKWNRRNGLYVSRDLQAGEILNVNDIYEKRPATDLEPRFKSLLISRAITRDVQAGDPITWDLID